MNLILAPLKGFTDSVFRNLYFRYFSGIDKAVSPFITSVEGSKIKASHIKDLTPYNNPYMPVVPQILSKSASEFIILAKALFDLGYSEVNLNLGCPYPMVANKIRGSGLLPFPERIDRFLEQVISKIPGKLSIKTRLGRWSCKEINRLIPVFNNYPISSITIHPRTGVQMYMGSVDLDGFEACLDSIKHLVIYNGDIRNYDDFCNLKSRFPSIYNWMLGRGILINPFLPEIIHARGVQSKFQIERFHKFHEVLFITYKKKLFGPKHVLNRMKGFWNYFALGFQNSEKVLKKILKSTTLEKYGHTVETFFKEQL